MYYVETEMVFYSRLDSLNDDVLFKSAKLTPIYTTHPSLNDFKFQ